MRARQHLHPSTSRLSGRESCPATRRPSMSRQRSARRGVTGTMLSPSGRRGASRRRVPATRGVLPGPRGQQGTRGRLGEPPRVLLRLVLSISLRRAGALPRIPASKWSSGRLVRLCLFQWLGGPAGLFCLPAIVPCGLGGRTQNTPGGGHARNPSPRPLLKARAGRLGGRMQPSNAGSVWAKHLLARDEARGP